MSTRNATVCAEIEAASVVIVGEFVVSVEEFVVTVAFAGATVETSEENDSEAVHYSFLGETKPVLKQNHQ